ncbi:MULTISPECIES: hypothetical protein [unclassified Novosphingobium]|uniref:hypothetical protein n=1 Tax=unclassified Novosphingobium TaxID=2644732 RepID=UPI00146A13DF|nr:MULTISPECIES: hypothetical protein [unclassified Novosphingobium]NMN05242.1 hypothetical protein [Novosphingobium sp. SG919]NMN87537.1 hypothetical protein [Novosphingobium sp. SG916]
MHRYAKIPSLLGASLLALAGGTALAETAPAIVAASITTSDLVIAPQSVPAAPAGKLLTLTVDGVEMPLAPGHYTGNVALTVTDDIPVDYHKVMLHHFRAAAYVENGVLVPAKSVTAALSPQATASDGVLANAAITSHGERFNGIVVAGTGAYRIDHPVIEFTGNGGNDFAGYGAGIVATDNADVTIDRPIIRTTGAIRTAVFVGGNATVHVNDAEIEVRNGTLPPDYKFTVDMGKMMEVPWMLGLSGNVRATNLVGNGTVFYNRSHIRAQGWGAVSTDDSVRVRMYVNDSLIETVDSGYGCYSIGDSIDTFAHSIVRAADVGCIMAAQGSVTFTDGTLVESGRFGVMMHSGEGGGSLRIDKGSHLRARETAIEVKGIGTTVLVDGATVQAGNGVILQSMDNDDPFMKAIMRGEIPAGMAAPPPGVAEADKKGPAPSPDVVATFRNTSLAGNFFNARSRNSAMILHFENARLAGQIATSTTAPALGKEPTAVTYREIGRVTNTAGFVAGSAGVEVILDATSHWTVTGPSYLRALTLAPGARLESTRGKAVMQIDGKTVPIRPGTYRGAIIVN